MFVNVLLPGKLMLPLPFVREFLFKVAPYSFTIARALTTKAEVFCALIKNWFMLSVRISSYGCTWEVWRALKKLELLLAAPRATLTLLSCSSNFPRASITRYTHAKHEPILKFTYFFYLFEGVFA